MPKLLWLKKNIEIKADKLIYDQKFSIIRALGDVEIHDLENNIILNSEEVIIKKMKKLLNQTLSLLL